MGSWRTIQDAPPCQTLRLRPQGDIGWASELVNKSSSLLWWLICRLLDNGAHPTRRGEGMGEETLFELPAIEERPGPAPTAPGEARVVRPMRHQLEWAAVDLESLLAQDHPARVIWGFVERLDLSAFYEPIKAVVDRPGRPTTDPQVLLGPGQSHFTEPVPRVSNLRPIRRACAWRPDPLVMWSHA